MFVQQLPGCRAPQKAQSSTGARSEGSRALPWAALELQVPAESFHLSESSCSPPANYHLTQPLQHGVAPRLTQHHTAAFPPPTAVGLRCHPALTDSGQGTARGTGDTQRVPSPSSQQVQTNLEGFLGRGRRAASSCVVGQLCAGFIWTTLVPRGPPAAVLPDTEMQCRSCSDHIRSPYSTAV